KPGDMVLTSGGDQIFPKGLPVGNVAKVSKGSEFLQITVKPAAILNHLEEVLVITKKMEHEAPLSPAAPVRAADILAQRLPSVPDKPAEPTPNSTAPNSVSPGVAPAVTHPAAAGEGVRSTTTPVAKTQTTVPSASVTAKPVTPTAQQPKPVVKPPVAAPPKPVADTTTDQP